MKRILTRRTKKQAHRRRRKDGRPYRPPRRARYLSRPPGGTAPDRELSHGARALLQSLRRARCRHVAGRGSVRYVGRSWLAHQVDRGVRSVSTYTAELERAGRIAKVPAPRYFDPEKGHWVTDGVQGYVILPTGKTAGHTDLQYAAAPRPSDSQARAAGPSPSTYRRSRTGEMPQPPPVAEVFARLEALVAADQPPQPPIRTEPRACPEGHTRVVRIEDDGTISDAGCAECRIAGRGEAREAREKSARERALAIVTEDRAARGER